MSAMYPVQTKSADQTRDLQRRHETLKPEQDKREPLVNSIEHGATIFVADIEKVAATTKKDANGEPVFRRTYADNGDGIPHEDMATLLRNPGTSSKPSGVFSGNHGMGLILANGMNNDAGLVVVSKTAAHLNPFMCVWAVLPDADDNPEGQLIPFWIGTDPDDEEEGEFTPVMELNASQGPTWDGIDWFQVWESAYDNVKFGGAPDHGTLVVECGTLEGENTYLRSQRNYDPVKGEWVYSRWATGEYYNSKFWSLPIDVFWGVPSSKFDWTFGEANKGTKLKRGTPAFGPGTWEYRSVTGLGGQIYLTTEDDDDEEAPKPKTKVRGKGAAKPRPKVTTDSGANYGGVCPFNVEVYMRELPEGVEARKLNFQVRRQGKIVVDFNGEIFEHPNPKSAHAQFGMTHVTLRENVWVRITPKNFGPVAGGVWMGDGRKALSVFTDNGDSIDFPWDALAEQFRMKMPPKLVEFIKALDSDFTVDSALRDKKLQSLWQKLAKSFTGTTPKKPKLQADPNGEKTLKVVDKGSTEKGDADGKRGPIENPGESHPVTGTGGPRKPPQKTPTVTVIPATPVPDKKKREPEPPKVIWVENTEEWPDEERWAVVYAHPSSANDGLGQVWLNWNHWYIQQRYEELASGIFSHAPEQVKGRMQELFALSVVTKIGHRMTGENKRAKTLGITPAELLIMFSPVALTGFVMGIWDHDQRLMQALGQAVSRIQGAEGVLSEDEAEPAAS